MTNASYVVTCSLLSLITIGVKATDFTVTSVANAGVGSLRQAILDANALPGLDTVEFDITGLGPHAIVLASALPTITDPLYINGYSEPGSSVNTKNGSDNAVLNIVVDGNGGGFPGFQLNSGSGGSTISGLCIQDFNAPGVVINVGSDNNRVYGNFLGTNVTGTALQGGQCNIQVFSSGNEIGSDRVRDRNMVCRHPSGAGLLVSGISATNNTIIGNFIGLSSNGNTVLGGLVRGIQVEAGAQNVEIGGDGDDEPNRITGTLQQGLVVLGAATNGVNIQGNHIYQTGGFPLDLNGDGQTPNDPGDGDTGPNGLANYPTILQAMTDEQGTVYAELSHQGPANQHYRFDWYEVGTPDASGHGDALRWLGRTYEYTDGAGNMQRHFTFGRGKWISSGTQITVTATMSADDNTSEHALNFTLALGQLLVTNTSEVVNGNTNSIIDLILSPGADGISLREAIMAGNNNSTTWGNDHVMFDIPGVPPHTIPITSSLPKLLSQFRIDGYSEPDYSGAPAVIIDGSSAGSGVHGFEVAWDWCDILGLSIVNFDGNGLHITEDDGDVTGMYIGLMPDGSTPAGNGGYGVRLDDVQRWEIGEDDEDRNVIAGNGSEGIRIGGSDSDENAVVGCYVGTNAAGTASIPNGGNGVLIDDGAFDNLIGGDDANERNVISGNDLSGIAIDGSGSDNNNIRGNFIGTNAGGTAPIPNSQHGVRLTSNASQNIVGGITKAEGNLISGNANSGVSIESGASANELLNNHIGVDLAGTANVANTDHGVSLSGADSNHVGGVGAGNTISFSGQNGIYNNSSDHTIIDANRIGVDASGNLDCGNGYNGILLYDSDDVIIGSAVGAVNVISGNGIDGIRISDSNGAKVKRALIGTDEAGTGQVMNDGYGIQVQGASNNNCVGTDSDGSDDSTERNVISGNYAGVRLSSGTSATGNTIAANLIGVDITGSTALPNVTLGIELGPGFTLTTIGTNGDGINDAFEGNIIGGNGAVGIRISSSDQNVIAGNKFGLGLNGTSAVPNADESIYLAGNSSDNVIGFGTAMSNTNALIVGNIFRNSARSGITLSGTGVGNLISRNSFLNNTGLGIDLNNDGVSSNDALDADSGANNGQNYPLITSAITFSGNTTITGTLNSAANADFRIEFFSLSVAHATGYGEAENFLGASIVSTDGSGNAAFSQALSAVALGDFISATATYLDAGYPKSTSEFSASVEVFTVEICGNGLDDDGDGLTDCADSDCSSYDNDSDAICDNEDLDDDNDGILDVDECNGIWVMDGSHTVLNHTSSNLNTSADGVAYDISTINGVALSTSLNPNLSNFVANVQSPFNGSQTQLYVQIETDVNAGSHGTLTIQFPNTVVDPTIRFSDLSSSVTSPNWSLAFRLISPGLSMQLLQTDGEFAVLGDTLRGSVQPSTNASGLVEFQGTTTELEFELLHYSPTSQDGPVKFALNMGYTSCGDVDADGVDNRFDLDADNDGIYDATEAGHGAMMLNGILAGGVDLFGVPIAVSAGGGMVNYTYADSDSDVVLDPYELDADGDGCFDVVEAGYTDANNDGFLGNAPLLVDPVTGLVTSGGP